MFDLFPLLRDQFDRGSHYDYEGARARERGRARQASKNTDWFVEHITQPTIDTSYKCVVDDQAMTLSFELPGVEPSDVNAQVNSEDRDVLLWWKKDDKELSRGFKISSGYDLDSVEVKLSLGVLEIKIPVLPKTEAKQPQGRKLVVKT